MAKKETSNDYMARDTFVVGGDDTRPFDGTLYSDKPFPGEGSVYIPGMGNKAGAGRGKRGGPSAKEVEGKKSGGSVKGWGKARGARAAKVY